MKSPWVITPKGKLVSRVAYDRYYFWVDLKKTLYEIEEQTLRESKIIMSQTDWDDILKFSKGEEE